MNPLGDQTKDIVGESRDMTGRYSFHRIRNPLVQKAILICLFNVLIDTRYDRMTKFKKKYQ